MAGRDVPRHLPAGRGIRATDLALVQIARPDDTTVVAATHWPPPHRPARRFDPLPELVPLGSLLTSAEPLTPRVTLGLNADDLEPLSVARSELGTSFMIVGSPGSGRSTALLLIARQLSNRRVAVSCGPRSPLLDHLDAIHLPRDDQDHAVALLDSLYTSGEAPDILIDDIDLLAEGPLWARVAELIQTPADATQIIAMAGSIDTMSAAFRGPIAQARRARLGLLLCPSGPHDGELFGVRLPRRRNGDDPPGRGWLARRGTATRLQLADPSGSATPASQSKTQPRTEFELSRFGGRKRE
jgi:DNA segregation ATPase FtsK/SpoIIIE, S-DNA-T family